MGYIDAEAPQKQGAPMSMVPYRKVIRKGEITIQVKSIEQFIRMIDQRVKPGGGYVSSIETRDDWASVTIRIPPEALNAIVWWLREQGKVTSEKLQAEDISEQYYDLQSRLKNQEQFEARLLEMAKTNTGNLRDLIQVEEKLNSVREQIETMEGRLRMFDNLTELTTITVSIMPASVPYPVELSFSKRLENSWRSSVQLLASLIQIFGVLVVAALPWMVLLLPFAFVVHLIWKRNRAVFQHRA